VSTQWPLSGEKASLQEGGIRVPSVVRRPARLKGGQVSLTRPVRGRPGGGGGGSGQAGRAQDYGASAGAALPVTWG
jgi:hypothetical protein